jgi:hypothetical protein
MLFNPKHENRLARSTGFHIAARHAPDAGPSVRQAFARVRTSMRADEVRRIDRLIEADAWTDAAMGLLEANLPAWQVRRLVYEDGEWHCSLSRQRNLPAEIDDTADACHELLPLAILDAFAEARRKPARRMHVPVAARNRQRGGYVHCCDNFA